MTNKELADWLSDLDSHSVYDVEKLDELDAHDRAVVPTQTPAQVSAAMKARGLGGWLDESIDNRLFTGYAAAEALSTHRIGHLPESVLRLSGRGSIHRACIQALREAPDREIEMPLQRFPN
jgi:hypothetical protein